MRALQLLMTDPLVALAKPAEKGRPSVTPRPKAVDLFAGAGGLSLGLEQAGFDVVAAVELDPVHCATHEFNFPDAATICADVRDLSGQAIRARAGLSDADEIDLVAGGPPCQGFSLIGKRALEDPRNALVSEFGRIVAELRPRYFLMENVAGLTVGKHRGLLDELVDFFGDVGYSVLTPYRVLQAADFGVPQSRRRVFLLGARQGDSLPAYPNPTHSPRSTKGLPPSEDSALPIGPSVTQALGDLPNAEDFEQLLTDDCVYAKFGAPSDYVRWINGADSGFGPETYADLRPHEPKLLSSSMRTNHSELSTTRFAETPGGQVEPVSRYLRLHPDGICNTLRAGTASDRGAFTSPRPIHPVWPRTITVREAARLHGYPDWFRLHVTKWHGMRQIGNSVPPPLARAVGASILAAMGRTPERGREVDNVGSEVLLSMTLAEAAAYYGVPSNVIPGRKRA